MSEDFSRLYEEKLRPIRAQILFQREKIIGRPQEIQARKASIPVHKQNTKFGTRKEKPLMCHHHSRTSFQNMTNKGQTIVSTM